MPFDNKVVMLESSMATMNVQEQYTGTINDIVKRGKPAQCKKAQGSVNHSEMNLL